MKYHKAENSTYFLPSLQLLALDKKFRRTLHSLFISFSDDSVAY